MTTNKYGRGAGRLSLKPSEWEGAYREALSKTGPKAREAALRYVVLALGLAATSGTEAPEWAVRAYRGLSLGAWRGQWGALDREQLQAMVYMVESGEARSPRQAAIKVLTGPDGKEPEATHVNQLQTKYKDLMNGAKPWFPIDIPADDGGAPIRTRMRIRP